MTAAPLVLFGAFDRHNLGDLLLAQVAARRAEPRPVLFAGLVARDLSAFGGPRVEALPALLATWKARFSDAPLDLQHVGGELLTVDAWQAAVMLQTPATATVLIGRLDGDPPRRLTWAQRHLGIARRAAYVLDRRQLPGVGHVSFNAVGGVDFERADESLRREVIDALALADSLTVRDGATRRHLQAVGIDAPLAADPVSEIADLFAGEVAEHRPRRHPYVALQFAAEYGDDATLGTLAAQLDQALAGRDLDVICFVAGAAPWHDDALVYRRFAGRCATGRVRCFAALDIWEICGLIAGATMCCATSLHALIVARAFAVPAIPMAADGATGQGGKLAAWLATWAPNMATVPPEDIGWHLADALP